ncbi:MAG: hypothetical protein C4293_18320, partial [Nitrospiraceae bacterium]
RDLTAIRTQAERIMRVTGSILNLSRGAVTTLKPIDLNCVIRTCLMVAGERVSARRIRLDSVLDPDLPLVMGDRARLETVVLNLINNAMDAVQVLDQQGIVTVESKRCRDSEGDWAVISVSDNGPGIPAAAMDRLFDPFFTTKPAGQGNGLGLFLSYGIVAEHRGRIEANNGDAGAIFTVQLPALVDVGSVRKGSAWEPQARS